MPIIVSEITMMLSGGAANADPNLALGGAISTTALVDASVDNLFDSVLDAEASAGDTEYRCFYYKNTHGSIAYEGAQVFIETNTPSVDSDISFAIGTSGVNGVEQTIADESTAPTGVTWENLTGIGNALSVGDIPAGEWIAIWVRRIISLGAVAYNGDQVLLKIRGTTSN